MLPPKIAFVDLETTGTSAQYDRVIEVGIVRVENGTITNTFSSLVNPNISIPHQITTITGISKDDLVSAPSFREIADDISDILHDCIFVAHNVRFDYSFLKHEFARLERRFVQKHFCTVRLSRILFPEKRHHNLDALIKRFQIECPNRHRALDDATVLVTFYERLQKTLAENILSQAVSHAMKQPSLPLHLQKEDLTVLPEAPGVYIFYGENNMPLYIGKSINIKDRVLSHFSSDITASREMRITQQIHKIESIPTAGELGALFLESQLVKKYLPMYNRKLRHSRELYVLKETTTNEEYKTVHLSPVSRIILEDLSDLQCILGIFKSKKEIKQVLTSLSKEYKLCEKLLGLEKTKDACFSSRLGICKGACINKEKPLFYNLRFTSAFSKSKIAVWPFKGPIIIEEKNMINGITEGFVFDKWCYLGHIRQNDNADRISEFQSTQFDLDTYSILRRYIKDFRNHSKIRTITNSDIHTVFNETQIPLMYK